MVKRIILYLPELLSLPVIALIVIGILFVSLLYMFITPEALELSSSSTQVTANGETPVAIEATVTNMLGFRLSHAKVTFSADAGHMAEAECRTDNGGTCSVDFIPEKSITGSRAVISAGSGDASDSTVVEMLGDEATGIKLELESAYLPSDGYSSTTVTASAYDDVGKPVPDGSRVSFSLEPAGLGSISPTYCTTLRGRCLVTFTGSTNPGNGSIKAESGSARTSTEVALMRLFPKTLELELSDRGVPADGEKQVLLSMSVADELGNPVPGQRIMVAATLGWLQEDGCSTDDTGQCSLTFTVGEDPGTAEITAWLDIDNISATRSIILMPISDLEVNMMAYENVGNPIIPAFVRGVEFHGHDMARIIITNMGSDDFKGTVSIEIPGWSEQLSEPVTVPVGETYDTTMTPPLKPAAYENLDSEPVHYLIVIKDSDGTEVYRNTYYTTLAPYNTMVWGIIWDNMIAAWDTPSAPEIHELVSEAADHTPFGSITGYQEISGYSRMQITYYHLKAIYDVLDDRGMRYVNAPYALEGMQTVYTPAQSLGVNGANCIDGTMVFASALTSMGMNPLVVLTSDHAFVCVQEWYGSDRIQCVETTMIGEADFQEAYEYGGDQFEDVRDEPGFRTVNVNSALDNGVKPLPS